MHVNSYFQIYSEFMNPNNRIHWSWGVGYVLNSAGQALFSVHDSALGYDEVKARS